jgi:cyclohexadienyl dehydratase
MSAVAMCRVAAVFLFALSTASVHAEDSRLDEVIKRGALRICTPGDYKPFSLAKADGTFEGIDVDLVQAMAKSLGVEARFVKTSWPKLMDDFVEKCDVGVGGISVTLDRQKRAFFTTAYMVNGKAPITKCENVAKFQTVADIDKPGVTVIENPGGSNERFARANFKQAKIVIFNDSTAKWRISFRAVTRYSRRGWTSGSTWPRRPATTTAPSPSG